MRFSSTTIIRRTKLWLFVFLTWPLAAASNVSVLHKQQQPQRRRQQQHQIHQHGEESSRHEQSSKSQDEEKGFNNFKIATTFTPIPKTTLNSKAISSSSTTTTTLNRKQSPSFAKQQSSSSYTFTSLSELLHDISSKNANINPTTMNTAFAQRLVQQEEEEQDANHHHHHHHHQEQILQQEATTEPQAMIASTTRHYSKSSHIWQPVFGSVVGILFASAFMSNPSVIWSEIWQTAAQVMAVHGLYKLVLAAAGVVFGGQQDPQQYGGGSWLRKAAMFALQLGYTSYFQIPSGRYSHSHSPQLYDAPESSWRNWLSTASSSAYAAAATATVFVAQALQHMVVNEVWNRFWKGSWMNQVVLSSIYYNNPFFFPISPTTKQKGQPETLPETGLFLGKVQDFVSDAIQRGSGKLIQGIIQKHVMQVASAWVQHGGAFLQQVWQQGVVVAMVSLFSYFT